jgi:hypothetical protein
MLSGPIAAATVPNAARGFGRGTGRGATRGAARGTSRGAGNAVGMRDESIAASSAAPNAEKSKPTNQVAAGTYTFSSAPRHYTFSSAPRYLFFPPANWRDESGTGTVPCDTLICEGCSDGSVFSSLSSMLLSPSPGAVAQVDLSPTNQCSRVRKK